MKRIISILLVVTMAISMFLITGCSKKTNDDETVRISVGAWPAVEGKALERYNDFKVRFEEKFPNVVIEPSTWLFDRQSFYAKAAGGQLPTVSSCGLTEIGTLLESGYIEDVSDGLKRAGYYDLIDKRFLDVIEEDGYVAGIPSSCYTLGIAYNVSLFKEAGLMNEDGTPKAPTTWEELAETAKIIKEKTGKAGVVFPTSSNCGGWYFTPLAWSFGTEFMKKNEDGKWIATFNSPECIAALQYIKDLKWKYDVLPSGVLVDNEELNKQFASGSAAMSIAPSNFPAKVKKYGIKNEDIGMFGIPRGPERHVTLLGGGVRIIPKGATAEQIDACIEWLAFVGEVAPYINDESKAALDSSYEIMSENGDHIGIKTMSAWGGNSEYDKYVDGLINKYRSVEENYYKLYNDSLTNQELEIQPEEPVCAQELYALLDNCMQEVLGDKNADCAKIIENAARQFQVNYLDKYAE